MSPPRAPRQSLSPKGVRNTALALALSLAMTPGCERRPAQPAESAVTGRTVVADLDAVGKALGRDVVILQKVEEATQSLNAQLIQAAQHMQGQLERASVQVGDQPTEEQEVQLRSGSPRLPTLQMS